MSSYHQIFLAPLDGSDEERTARRLGDEVGVHFEPQVSEYADYVAGDGCDIVLDLGGHDLESDRDLDFEHYPFVITVRRVGTDVESPAAAARRLFETLRRSGGYRLLLTEDLQRVVDRYDPVGRAT